MNRQINKLLQDIFEAANSIDSFIEGFKLSDYQKSKLVRRAVERELIDFFGYSSYCIDY